MKEITESSIFNEVYKVMCSRDYAWNEEMTIRVIRSVFKGYASFLGEKKSKDNPVAIGLYDKNDKLHFAGIVEYQKSEEEGTDEGSWTLSYTFDENDIDKNITKIYKVPEDQEACAELTTVAYETEAVTFTFASNPDPNVTNDGSPSELMIIVMDVIRDYMRANLTIDPALTIANIAKFTAVADTTNKDVIIGIEPDEMLRQMVKGDSSIDA